MTREATATATVEALLDRALREVDDGLRCERRRGTALASLAANRADIGRPVNDR